MRTVSLCLDYNNICFRALYTCKYGNEEVNYFDTEDECRAFARKVVGDIVNLVSTFNPNEVFFIFGF